MDGLMHNLASVVSTMLMTTLLPSMWTTSRVMFFLNIYWLPRFVAFHGSTLPRCSNDKYIHINIYLLIYIYVYRILYVYTLIYSFGRTCLNEEYIGLTI